MGVFNHRDLSGVEIFASGLRDSAMGICGRGVWHILGYSPKYRTVQGQAQEQNHRLDADIRFAPVASLKQSVRFDPSN